MPTSVPIQSPLVDGAAAMPIDAIPSDAIVQGYAKRYDVDVSDYFKGIDQVLVYECQETGYRFYYPFSLAGRESLYRHLQRFDWNYKSNKWEYEAAIRYIPKGSRVLDVGCGRGAFVKIAGLAGLTPHGLELNTVAVKMAQGEGLSVSVGLIGVHAARFPQAYDAVCSFQVLEHVPDVRQFISDCVRALRPGGTLIYGVPNNDGFLRFDRQAVLNAPPHHMGLWTEKSLSALPRTFPLNLKVILIEPLAEVDWYVAVMERRYIPVGFMRSFYYRLGVSRLFRRYVDKQAARIPGHTILAVYEKRA